MSKKSLQEVTEEMKGKGLSGTHITATPNQAANILLDQLDPNEQDYYRNIALENGYELWQLLASILRLACDRGDGTAGVMDSRWAREGTNKKDDGICIMCKTKFEITRLGQKVCGNACGNKWENKKLLDAYNAKNPVCVYCGEPFVAELVNQLYDSQECSDEHKSLMKKDVVKSEEQIKESSGKRLEPLKIGRK